jgi:hypothetical protein
VKSISRFETQILKENLLGGVLTHVLKLKNYLGKSVHPKVSVSYITEEVFENI